MVDKMMARKSGIITVILLLVLLVLVSSCSKNELIITPEFNLSSLNTTNSGFSDSISNSQDLKDIQKYTNDSDFLDLRDETKKFISSKAISSYRPDYSEDFLENG